MKKLLTISMIATLLISFNSCSNDDDSNAQEQDYVITLESDCGNTNSRTTYCVTENEYRSTFDNTPVGDPCPYVIITDIDGNNHSGILRSGGTGDCDNL